ncbi:MAG: IS200/IS605 family transposase [Pyrinomonadaceae bacterium]|nr:IS200/IS605 family transposase [Pyrinomonadaceae bacterium]
MANTYSNLFYHLVFSTKGRRELIHRDIEERVWAYIGGIARKHGMTALQIGGIETHIHALVMAKPVHSPSEIAKYIKGDSSKWIHTEFPDLSAFAWQDGYGVFSVSKSNVPEVIEYIQGQREHHKLQTFEDEYVSMLRFNGIEYDERYLFD